MRRIERTVQFICFLGFRRPWHGCDDNIKKDLEEVG
jgi:hypothetical protein